MIPAIMTASNAEVVAVASRTKDRAQQFANEFNIPHAYGSYEEMLADGEIDAIYNPLPVSMHAAWSIACAEAGKPTLCEKPLSRTLDEARRMEAAFRERGVLLSEVMMYRYHPVTQRVRQIVQDGGIGKLVAIRASFFVSIPPGNIRLQDDTGGGSLLDLGCYCVGIMRYLTGEEPVESKAVAAWLGGSVDEALAGVLRFPSGVTGYFCTSLASAFDCSYDVMGTTGRLRIDRGGMVLWPGEEFTIEHWHDDTCDRIKIPEADHNRIMVEDFSEAVLTGRPTAFSVADSIGNMAVIESLLNSARVA